MSLFTLLFPSVAAPGVAAPGVADPAFTLNSLAGSREPSANRPADGTTNAKRFVRRTTGGTPARPGFYSRGRNGRETRNLVAAAILIAVISPNAKADSLFPTKQASQAARGSSAAAPAFLFSDNRAHGVGDPLLIVVAENTSASSSANTKTSQNDSVNVFGGAGLFNRIFKQLSLSAQNQRSGDGSGTTTRSGSLVTTLSVLVKEVLPNGTLRVEGSRLVTINRETQRVVFSGIVRPEDIGQDNTVSSNLVASAEVRYEGKGVVSEHQRQGILTRIFRFLF